MGTITFQVIGDGSVGTKTKSFTVSDAHINRLVAVWQTLSATPENPTPTVAQALLAWADHVMQVAKTDVLRQEQIAATNAVSEITAT